jgi:predicted secreted protein
MSRIVEDARSKKIILLSHCVLNQNAKVRGIATYPGSISPVSELLLQSDVGLFQMPCPEMKYYGAMRWGQVRDQYDSPMFRNHCRRLADSVLDEVEDYKRSGYQILGFVMIDGSPVCGLRKVPQPAKQEDLWGGMVWYTPEQKFVSGTGVYCQVLKEFAIQRGLDRVPFTSLPEVEEAGSLALAIDALRELLQENH